MADGATEQMLARADRNMQVAWTEVVAAIDGSLRQDDSGAVMLSSRVPVALFNPTFVSGRVEDPEAAVATIGDFYRRIEMPFVVYFRDSVTPGLAETCIKAGWIEHFQPPVMVMDPIVSAPAPPAGLEIQVGVGPEDVPAYLAVLAEAFEAPLELMEQAFGPAMAGLPSFTAVLGHLDGVPVSTSGLFLVDGIAGIYNVATLPSARGKGVGAALTWAAVAAGAEAGATAAILQSSELGQPVYSRMGFSTPARYRQFEGPAG